MTTGMKQLMADVRAFHEKCGVKFRGEPVEPTREEASLMLSLIAEEFCELLDCFGAKDPGHIRSVLGRSLLLRFDVVLLEEAADSIVDLIYVLVRAALVCGIPLDRVWSAVQRANMAKAGGPVREDGKLLKPPDWQPPDIHRAIWGAGGDDDGE